MNPSVIMLCASCTSPCPRPVGQHFGVLNRIAPHHPAISRPPPPWDSIDWCIIYIFYISLSEPMRLRTCWDRVTFDNAQALLTPHDYKTGTKQSLFPEMGYSFAPCLVIFWTMNGWQIMHVNRMIWHENVDRALFVLKSTILLIS